jgi:integrase
MANKLPELRHVKYVRAKGRVYPYFNTGQKKDGKPIYARLPHPSAPGFYDAYAALVAGRTKRIATSYSVADLAEDYRRSKHLSERADNTRRLYKSMLSKIVATWGEFPASDLQPTDVSLAIENESWNAGTHNMVIAVLAVLYKWARKNGKATGEPTKDIERRKGGEHDPWPEHVLEAALAADYATIRLATHLLYFTGLRIGDACRLRWTDIRGGIIHITPEKTRRFKKNLEIYVHTELQAELDRTPKSGFTILHGTRQRDLRNALKEFTRKLGHETVPHGLRKNAVIALLEAGSTVPEVAAITGQTYQVVEHYAARVSTRKLGKAAMLKFEVRRNKT